MSREILIPAEPDRRAGYGLAWSLPSGPRQSAVVMDVLSTLARGETAWQLSLGDRQVETVEDPALVVEWMLGRSRPNDRFASLVDWTSLRLGRWGDTWTLNTKAESDDAGASTLVLQCVERLSAAGLLRGVSAGDQWSDGYAFLYPKLTGDFVPYSWAFTIPQAGRPPEDVGPFREFASTADDGAICCVWRDGPPSSYWFDGVGPSATKERYGMYFPARAAMWVERARGIRDRVRFLLPEDLSDVAASTAGSDGQ